MNIKTIVKYFIVIGLICFAGYLTFDLVSGNIAQNQDVNNFCTQKCSYNPASYFWEFSGESGIKGFTTKDECFKYCSKVRQGFAYLLTQYATAFVSNIFNWIKIK